MRLCCGFVMFRSLVVCVFHVDFSCWPKEFGTPRSGPNSGRLESQSCFNRERDLHHHRYRELNSRCILALWSSARPDEVFLRGRYHTGRDQPVCCRSRTRLRRRSESICSTPSRSVNRGCHPFRGRRSWVVRIHIFLGARRDVRPRQCGDRRSSGPAVDRRSRASSKEPDSGIGERTRPDLRIAKSANRQVCEEPSLRRAKSANTDRRNERAAAHPIGFKPFAYCLERRT
jgi:hypothetical protein